MEDWRAIILVLLCSALAMIVLTPNAELETPWMSDQVSVPCDLEYDHLVPIDREVTSEYRVNVYDDYWDFYVNVVSKGIFDVELSFNGVRESLCCNVTKCEREYKLDRYYEVMGVHFIPHHPLKLDGCIAWDNERLRKRLIIIMF